MSDMYLKKLIQTNRELIKRHEAMIEDHMARINGLIFETEVRRLELDHEIEEFDPSWTFDVIIGVVFFSWLLYGVI